MSVCEIPYHPLDAKSGLVPLYVKVLNVVHKVNPFAVHFILRCMREQHQCQGFLSNKFSYFAAKLSLRAGQKQYAGIQRLMVAVCSSMSLYIYINISFMYIFIYKFIFLYTIYMVYIFIYLCVCLYIINALYFYIWMHIYI